MLDALTIKNDKDLGKVMKDLGFVSEPANKGTRATFIFVTNIKELMSVPCQFIGWEQNPTIRMQVIVSVENGEFR